VLIGDPLSITTSTYTDWKPAAQSSSSLVPGLGGLLVSSQSWTK